MDDVKSKYKEAQERAWKYVKSEVLVDKDHIEWWEHEAEAAIKGEEFNEPEPQFDNEKVQFNGVDMFNSFMGVILIVRSSTTLISTISICSTIYISVLDSRLEVELTRYSYSRMVVSSIS